MSILVVNCFHWVGFHLVMRLLENGYQVDGYTDDTTLSSVKEDHLSMFLGRNSSFSVVSDLDSLVSYDKSIIINDDCDLEKIDANHIIKLTDPHESYVPRENMTVIKRPLLYGEWMPMSEKGLYINNQLIDFDADIFLENAIYINDFITEITEIIELPHLPPYINVKLAKNREKKEFKLENNVYINDNTSKEYKVKKVITHYKKFKRFYN